MLQVQSNNKRQVISLDGIWHFRKEDETSFRPIAVPASWNEQYEDLYAYHGVGIYEKTFYAPKFTSDEAVILRFGSAPRATTVYVNDAQVMYDEENALPFEADITDVLRDGENSLRVVCDTSLDIWSMPPATQLGEGAHVGFTDSFPDVMYDFYPYSGIHRSVYLAVMPKKKIEDVTVKTYILEDGTARVTYKVEGNTDGISVTTDGQESNSAEGEFIIKNPRIWGIYKPELYNLTVKTAYDEYTVRYGIRTIKVVGNDILLNGEKIFLKGFGKHEDFPLIGKGFFAPGVMRDFDLMKSLGANSFRTSHYPYDEQMLDMADELGILVISETTMVGLCDRMYTREGMTEKCCKIVERLVRRDKNHPSVISWSLANEPDLKIEEGMDFFKAITDTARAIDDTRPLSYAAHREASDNPQAKYFDFVGINKYYGWYVCAANLEGTLPMFKECIESFNKTYNIPVYVAEFGCDAIAGVHTNPPQMFSEEYQAKMLKLQYEMMKNVPCCCGSHIWAFADFRVNQSQRRVVDNRKGVFTRTRDPKLSYNVVKEMWKD